MLSGKTGSGKTTLAKIISGQLQPSFGEVIFKSESDETTNSQVEYVPNWFQFADLEGSRNFYYQQRYNKSAKNTTPTVLQELKQYGQKFQLLFSDAEALLVDFNLRHAVNRQLHELSSGEHKKLQLIKAFWRRLPLMIFDQPYSGLDRETRKILNQTIQKLQAEGVTFILLNNEKEFPETVNHFAFLKEGKILETKPGDALYLKEIRQPKPLPYFLKPINSSDEVLINMKNISVAYDDHLVLKNINWTVKSGEQWLLKGHNGSGKSTLLSLISADHPQAYANDLELFGKKRGSGESIWDIKEKIGHISPELHWYFDLNANVGQAIASGFFDAMSLYKTLSFEQSQQLEQLLVFFDLKEDKNKKLNRLSLGKQRLALLARTLIKKPKILILDEPCQGLDDEQTQYFNAVVDDLAKAGQTIIYVGHFESQWPSQIKHTLLLENGKVIENSLNLKEKTQ